eukprot:scaffold499898_cov18-Prasinocladus_malaysianus.AAC.2
MFTACHSKRVEVAKENVKLFINQVLRVSGLRFTPKRQRTTEMKYGKQERVDLQRHGNTPYMELISPISMPARACLWGKDG